MSGCIGKAVGLRYAFYFQYYIELIPLIDRIYNGENVLDEYKALEPTKKLVACMIVCARFANLLDKSDDDNGEKKLAKCHKNVANFLSKAGHENVLISVRSQVCITRIVKHMLDEQPFWSEMLQAISKEVEG